MTTHEPYQQNALKTTAIPSSSPFVIILTCRGKSLQTGLIFSELNTMGSLTPKWNLITALIKEKI